jgi:hypothetical protein
MVVARKCAEVLDLWPVYARWAYFNIDEINDDRFWQSIKDRGQSYRRYDVPNGRLLDMNEDPAWRPSKTTCITEIRKGVWTWQIPTHNERVLSFGVVSKTDKVDEAAFFEIAEKHHAPQYTLSRRPRDGSSGLNRFHLRNNFAQYAKTPATLDYILVGDAYAFADPIFSVGTGLAVNKAIEVAALLNEGEWNQSTCERYCTEYKQLFDRAIKAFESWYDQSLMISDEAAVDAQLNFLVGTAFQVGVATHYSRVLMDSGAPLDEAAPGGGGRHALDPMAEALTNQVAALLELTEGSQLGEWTFGGAYRTHREVQHRWTHPDKPELVINTSFDGDTTRYYRKVGNVSLSFMNLWDRPYPFDERCVALFDCLEERISAASAQWNQLGREILS